MLSLSGLHYGIIYPFHEFQTGRNLRMSPIYPKLREAGAVFGQVMGYERPTWFDPDYTSGMFLQFDKIHTVTVTKLQ
jgi:pyruvate dehydrogenase phosphatase regulatory subunit